jgi:hypothetical protein
MHAPHDSAASFEKLPASHELQCIEPEAANLPAAQEPLHTESVRPVVVPYRPASHAAQTFAPTSEYLPCEQLPDGDDKPEVAQNEPAMHGEHFAWPVEGLNCPCAQAVQLADVELAWKYPELQLTQVPAAFPAYWPAGQLSQSAAPTVLTNDPSSQSTHVDDEDEPTSREKVPTGQPTHVVSEFAPSTEE